MLLSGVLEQEGSGGTPPLSLLEVSKRGTRMRYSSNSFVKKVDQEMFYSILLPSKYRTTVEFGAGYRAVFI